MIDGGPATRVRELRTAGALRTGFTVLRELRPHLSFRDFMRVYRHAQRTDRYSVAALFIEEACVAVMGYRVLVDCAHGRHLYVDDLVTSAAFRGKGLGAKLLKYAETKAGALRCKSLRLCVGVENEGGKRFYEREGWRARSIAYKKVLPA